MTLLNNLPRKLIFAIVIWLIGAVSVSYTTSDAADDMQCVVLRVRRNIQKQDSI